MPSVYNPTQIYRRIRRKAGAASLSYDDLDGLVFIDPVGATQIVQLPPAVTVSQGAYLVIVQDGAGSLDIRDGASSLAVTGAAGDRVDLTVDNGSWALVGSSYGASGGTSNCVEVTSLADLPPPSGGQIVLAPRTVYHVCADLDLGANTLVLNDGTRLMGASSVATTITGSSSVMISTIPGALGNSISGITLNVPAGSTGIELSNNPAYAHTVENVRFVGGGRAIYASNIQYLVVGTCGFSGLSDGIVLENNIGALVVDKCASADSNLSGYSFIRTLPGVVMGPSEIRSCIIQTTATDVGLSIDLGSTYANLLIFHNFFSGPNPSSPPPSTLKADPRIVSVLNVGGFGDSIYSGACGYVVPVSSSVPVVFTAPNQWVDIPGPWVLDSFSERFTMPSPGVLQYDGLEDIPVIVLISVGVGVDSTFGFKEMRARAVLNGVPIQGVEAAARVHDVIPEAASSFGGTAIAPGDQIKMQLSNRTDATNLDVTFARMLVQRASR